MSFKLGVVNLLVPCVCVVPQRDVHPMGMGTVGCALHSSVVGISLLRLVDLTYIGAPGSQLIAMSNPVEGLEAIYRNIMAEVKRFFEIHHKGHYSVYNLCSERQYDLRQNFARSVRFGFDDHNRPPAGPDQAVLREHA